MEIEFKHIEEALQDYKLYNSKGELLPATIYNLPLIFSSFINNRTIHELKIDLWNNGEKNNLK